MSCISFCGMTQARSSARVTNLVDHINVFFLLTHRLNSCGTNFCYAMDVLLELEGLTVRRHYRCLSFVLEPFVGSDRSCARYSLRMRPTALTSSILTCRVRGCSKERDNVIILLSCSPGCSFAEFAFDLARSLYWVT